LETFSVLSRAKSAATNAARHSYKSQGSPGLSVDQITKGITAPVTESFGKTAGAGIANMTAKALGWKGAESQLLQDAAKKGQQALNAKIFVLMQQNSQFRKHMLETEDNGSR